MRSDNQTSNNFLFFLSVGHKAVKGKMDSGSPTCLGLGSDNLQTNKDRHYFSPGSDFKEDNLQMKTKIIYK